LTKVAELIKISFLKKNNKKFECWSIPHTSTSIKSSIYRVQIEIYGWISFFSRLTWPKYAQALCFAPVDRSKCTPAMAARGGPERKSPGHSHGTWEQICLDVWYDGIKEQQRTSQYSIEEYRTSKNITVQHRSSQNIIDHHRTSQNSKEQHRTP
jgi:hypothetical protein